jgi:uncharacterized protein YdeI (YjbR/CyaY-like superfamily)
VELDETLDVSTANEFRTWLSLHHESKDAIWLLFYKKASGRPSISYEDAVEEAICYGWIDSRMKGIDSERYAMRFTPRRKASNWSDSNRARALKMVRAGKMTSAGFAALPDDLRGTLDE